MIGVNTLYVGIPLKALTHIDRTSGSGVTLFKQTIFEAAYKGTKNTFIERVKKLERINRKITDVINALKNHNRYDWVKFHLNRLE